MYKRTLFCLAILFATHFAYAQNFLSVNGTSIVDPNGKPLQLKGINTGNWLVPEGYMFKFKTTNSGWMINQVWSELVGPSEAAEFWGKFLNSYITHEDIKYIKSLGFNHIRVPFNYRMLSNELYMGKVNAGIGYLDKVVEWCKMEGLWVVLDMHCAPGGQTGDNIDDSYGYPYLFENANDQKSFTDIWTKLAVHYKDNPTVMGYELLNEPIAHFLPDTATLNRKLEGIYKMAVKAIRTVDKNHIIILGGAQWDTNFKIFGAPFDSKLVYAFHRYWMEPDYESVKQYIDFSKKYNVPIFLNESGENSDEWITRFRSLLEENHIGWTFWTYKRMDAKSCVVSVKVPEFYDKIINFAEADRSSFEKIRKSKPSVDSVRVIMNDYLQNIQLINCQLNDGYVKALGLQPQPVHK